MKKSNHRIVKSIDVTPDQAWKIIGAVDGVDQWLAPITACRVEGNQRICNTAEGEFTEDILNVDHENRVLHYAIPKQHMIPVENIVGNMKVISGSNTKVEWSWEFDVEESKEAEAREILATVGNMGISGIEELIKAQSREPVS